jgi:hypothetical protein
VGVGRKATTLLCKKDTVAKSKEVKTRCNLAEYSEESCGSETAVSPMVMNMATSHLKTGLYATLEAS